MKLELKPFQEAAAREILAELSESREAVVRGKPQAVVLSAPTGSGKTITVARVIDLMFGGGDGIEARPKTVFLWLSDSPELNAQSANKLIGACDHLPFHKMVTISGENFSEDSLQPGFLYFINTQLLGKDKLLTKEPGDRREFTFWQTVANTVAKSPEDFVLIIDEAHRGASASDKNRTPIMQKFIRGSAADELPAVPLVLGMSATPQRFTTLLGNTNRTQRPVNIDPEDVRQSGLLKDWIVVENPKTAAAGEITLLEEAAKKWQDFTRLWRDYCLREKERELVKPILVVQVEDGGDSTLTRSPLNDIVRVIERQSGPLGLNEIVHCFQEKTDIQAGGRIIRKLEPSRVQGDPDVRVVLFKTALTTGWDCPRAEVMMSFRRAKDATAIAQLVGRMVRTPLARRIGTDEVLDTVELFLPHFDADTLEEVLKRLRNPEAEEGVPTRVETSVEAYSRDPALAKVFERLHELPTYAVERVPKMSDVKRALRLAGMLVHEEIDSGADDSVRTALVEKLKELGDGFASTVSGWATQVREGGEMDIDVTHIAAGGMNVTSSKVTRVLLSEENIDQLFDAAGRLLASGEGLHRSYWKRYHDKENPNQAKLVLYATTRQAGAIPALNVLANQLFDSLWAANKQAIQAFPAATKRRFTALVQATGQATSLEWELPTEIVERKYDQAWRGHLYSDAEKVFYTKLNGWEAELLTAEMRTEDFVAWLRNFPRREWALCIPYELAGQKPFYPDFVIVRKKGKGFVVDILEPHDDTRTDTWAKAKGLAAFADEHGVEFGRLLIARKRNNTWQFADMNDKNTRAKARKLQSSSDLESIFA
jgi:type III restriction enzyme